MKLTYLLKRLVSLFIVRRSRQRARPSALLLALLMCSGYTQANAQVTANTLPTGSQVTQGSASVSAPAVVAGRNTLNINQQSQQAILNWNTFNIGSNGTVNFQQPNASAVALNRVTTGGGSEIFGQLNANGNVFLVNPNGVLFGAGAQVNVGGLVASTMDISDADFMAGGQTGNYKFSSYSRPNQLGYSSITTSNPGKVTNLGQITALGNGQGGGSVVLLGQTVSNEGVIAARLGSVALAAGGGVTLEFAGNRLVKLQVDAATVDTLVANSGTIKAGGGWVLMNAQTAAGLARAVVNHSGIIEAQTVADLQGTPKEGKVEILADFNNGTAIASGTVDVSASGSGNGGFVETSASQVKVTDSFRVNARAAKGQSGTWLIDPQDYTIAATGGDITGAQLSNNLTGANVTIISSSGGTAGSGDINVNDNVSWSANTLTLTAARDININATMTASGTSRLTMNTGTANGADAGVASGAVNVSFRTFNGATSFNGNGVRFGTRSGNGFLTINGANYTVINALGVDGSTTGLDLQGINATLGDPGNLSGNYALGADIDASPTGTASFANGFKPIGDFNARFTGNFDGLGNRVLGLTVKATRNNDAGLFGTTAFASIRNVGVFALDVQGGASAGALVGSTTNSTRIANSFSSGTVSGVSVSTDSFVRTGGLVGVLAESSTVDRSFSSAVVSSNSDSGRVGGLVGSVEGSTVSNSTATGNVQGAGNSNQFGTGGLVGNASGSRLVNNQSSGTVTGVGSAVGGLVGSLNLGSIERSSSSSAVTTGTAVGTTLGQRVGGLVGNASASTISQSYATGTVLGLANVGGLVGSAESTTISDSYATGAVTGNLPLNSFTSGFVAGAGALVGLANASRITNSYATGLVNNTNSVNRAGGLIGGAFDTPLVNSFWDITSTGRSASTGGNSVNGQGAVAGGVGLSTAQMQQQANFTSATATNSNVNPNWDFANTWVQYSGNTRPLLRAFMTPLTITADDTVRTYDGTGFSTAGAGVTFSAVPDARLLGSLAVGGTAQGARNVGSYTITPAGFYSDQQGYIITNVSGALTINPQLLVIRFDGASKVYDGTAAATVTGVRDNRVVGDALTVGFTGASYFDKNVGGFKEFVVAGVTVTGNDAGNYNLLVTNGLSSITPRDLTISASSGTSKVYDATATALVNVSDNRVAGDLLTISSTASFNNANVGTGKAITLTGVGITGVDAGNYNLVSSPTAATGSITPAPLSVAANSVNRTYDGSPNGNTAGVSLTGFVGGQTAVVLGGSLALNGSAIGAADAGNYTITPSGLTSSNYAISFTDGSLTINPADLFVALNNAGKFVGATDPALTFRQTGGTLFGTDQLTGTPVRVAGEAAGNYAIGAGSIAATSNYRVVATPGVFEIAAAPPPPPPPPPPPAPAPAPSPAPAPAPAQLTQELGAVVTVIAGLANISNPANGVNFGPGFGPNFGRELAPLLGQTTSQPNKNDVVFAVNPNETDSAKTPALPGGKLITIVGSGVNEGP